MGLTFENNTIENFDVQATFGMMNFLEVVAINERDGENNVTEEVREQRVTVYSSKLNDQVEIVIDPDYDVSGINYDDEIELTGNVTARGWLYTFNSAGHSYSYKVFSIKDIENFQELLRLRENNVPLNEAINEVFMSDENKATHINKQEIEDLKRDMRQLLKVSQSILAENASLKERIGALERGTAE